MNPRAVRRQKHFPKPVQRRGHRKGEDQEETDVCHPRDFAFDVATTKIAGGYISRTAEHPSCPKYFPSTKKEGKCPTKTMGRRVTSFSACVCVCVCAYKGLDFLDGGSRASYVSGRQKPHPVHPRIRTRALINFRRVQRSTRNAGTFLFLALFSTPFFSQL